MCKGQWALAHKGSVRGSFWPFHSYKMDSTVLDIQQGKAGVEFVASWQRLSRMTFASCSASSFSSFDAVYKIEEGLLTSFV